MNSNIYHYLRLGMSPDALAKRQGISLSSVYKARKVKPQRILLVGDLHCGHNTGLTPPAYQYKIIEKPETEEHNKRNKWATLQHEMWDWYITRIDELRPINRMLVLGDTIDGSGEKSGGTELITTDRKVQCQMAIEALKIPQAGKVTMVFGTAYHTGAKEDFEIDVARELNAKIGSHERESVFGCVIDFRHHQGNTKNPLTSLINELINNREWAVDSEQPKADVIIRAHTHRYCFARMEDCVLISIPALTGYGSKFGARRCSRKVCFGLVALDVWPDGYVQEYCQIAKLKCHKTKEN